jgi:hypothetical protein
MRDKELLKTEEWIYLENETLAKKLSPPPELPGEEEIHQASPVSSVPNKKPPPKLPDDQANSIAWPLSKSKIRATTPILQCIKRHTKPPGQSSKGVMALNTWGKLGLMRDENVQLRLDSGADITLISEDCYKRLCNPPKLRQGMKLKLWALTNNVCIIGYINLIVLV